MKEYYLDRFRRIFHYSDKKFLYVVAKTLCLLVGVPLYAVLFLCEMVLTAVNMLFMWIPALNVVVQVICKSLIFVCDLGFYLCILPDIKAYREERRRVRYEVHDADEDEEEEVAGD